MRLPQPFQYQGSKRLLAPAILAHLPPSFGRLVEPFAGSAALSIAAAATGRTDSFWLNDINRPLAELLEAIIRVPDSVFEGYRSIWKDSDEIAPDYYLEVRDQFNESQDPILLLYLIARCVKGAVRYNASGGFNQSADKRRAGVQPRTLHKNVLIISELLKDRTTVTSYPYQDVLNRVTADDIVYMDPPYQGVCAGRDSRYAAGIDFRDFVSALEDLGTREVPYALSYDGRTGDKTYGVALPSCLDLTLIELDAGVSTQATLLGREDRTVESLYLSPSLVAMAGTRSDRRPVTAQPEFDFVDA